MARSHLREVAPHYVAMTILLLIVFNLVRLLLDDPDFWLLMAAGLVVVFAYRPLVVRLGVAPSVWEER